MIALVAIALSSCERCGGASEPLAAPEAVTHAAEPSALALPEPIFSAHDPVDRPSGIAISADGRTVAFSCGGRVTADDSDADDDVFVYDVGTRAITRVSIGGQGPAYLEERGVSADGSRILFTSSDPLVEDDRNDRIDVYMADRSARSVTRVTLGPEGRELDGVSYMAAISGDGRVVAFTTHADRVVPGDRDEVRDVYVRDLASGVVERASVGPGGRGPSGEVSAPLGLSADGARVAFFTTDLVPHDPPADSFSGELDVFTRGEAAARFGLDLHEHTITSLAADGHSAVGMRHDPERTIGVRVDLDTGVEVPIEGTRSVEAIAASPDGHVVAVVDWSAGTEAEPSRVLRVLRDGAIAWSRPLVLDLASTHAGWHGFAVANDGTVVAHLVVRRWESDAWAFRSCVAILAPSPIALACSPPRESEEL